MKRYTYIDGADNAYTAADPGPLLRLGSAGQPALPDTCRSEEPHGSFKHLGGRATQALNP